MKFGRIYWRRKRYSKAGASKGGDLGGWSPPFAGKKLKIGTFSREK